jgi:hypothetical protein
MVYAISWQTELKSTLESSIFISSTPVQTEFQAQLIAYTCSLGAILKKQNEA